MPECSHRIWRCGLCAASPFLSAQARVKRFIHPFAVDLPRMSADPQAWQNAQGFAVKASTRFHLRRTLGRSLLDRALTPLPDDFRIG